MISEFSLVGRFLGNVLDKPGSRVLAFLGIHRRLFHEPLLPDVPLDKAVDVATSLAESSGVVNSMERGQSEAFGKALLCDVKALGEFPVLSRLIDAGAEAVNGPAEEQFCGHIHGQIKEERLEVDVAVGRYAVDQVADVFVEVAKVLILRADELLSE